MRCLALIFASLLGIAHGHVTFPLSEVLQGPDLARTNYANFNCKNGCKVYVDRQSDKLMVTQKGVMVQNFNTIFGGKALAPAGAVLPPGDDYKLENKGEVDPQFVFYVVDSASPNYNNNIPVLAPTETKGVVYKGTNRYVTVLSSHEAIEFSAFTGASGRLSASLRNWLRRGQRHSVQARIQSEHHALTSWPTVGSAVLTVDFGFVGDHNVSIYYETFKDPMKNAFVSTVYTSPGYIGCSYSAGQNYYSPIAEVVDAFMFTVDSLDIEGTSSAIADTEIVHFSVNDDKLDMAGTSSLDKHYGKGSIKVAISWQRKTPESSFALQLDFGNDPQSPPKATTASTVEMSTTSCSSLSNLLAFAFIVAACLMA